MNNSNTDDESKKINLKANRNIFAISVEMLYCIIKTALSFNAYKFSSLQFDFYATMLSAHLHIIVFCHVFIIPIWKRIYLLCIIDDVYLKEKEIGKCLFACWEYMA